jgi:hypothetical protein
MRSALLTVNNAGTSTGAEIDQFIRTARKANQAKS